MKQAARRFARDRIALGAGVVLVLALTAAALGPAIAPYDPLAVDLARNYQPSSWAHPLGTDHLGRDTLSRLIVGARVSLGIAAASTLAGVIVGATLGLVAAWRRGWADIAIGQGVDILLSLPEMLMGMPHFTVLARGTLHNVAVACSSAASRASSARQRWRWRHATSSSRRALRVRRTGVSSSAICCRTACRRSSRRAR